jgi:hypothetical protein
MEANIDIIVSFLNENIEIEMSEQNKSRYLPIYLKKLMDILKLILNERHESISFSISIEINTENTKKAQSLLEEIDENEILNQSEFSKHLYLYLKYILNKANKN